MPRGEIANRHNPNGLGWSPYWRVSPAPRPLNSPGVIASWVMNRSWSRPGLDNPAEKVASRTLRESASTRLAWFSVSTCRNCLGLRPAQRVKTR